MATKEISQLPSTNVSNDTDLLMTRQGSQDRAVQVQTVRNVGTEPGQNLGVGSYGTGGDAISITSIYASNNANLIDRGGVYAVNGTTNVPVAQGELTHSQLSSTSATQHVVGENQEAYWRKKVGGTWLAWVLDSAANKATVRTDLSVPSTSEALLVANNLSDVDDPATARNNLGISDYIQTGPIALDGDFTSGSIYCTKIGNIVTITSSNNVGTTAGGVRSTLTGVVPAAYRPTNFIGNPHWADSNVEMVTVLSDGKLNVRARELSTGNIVNLTNWRDFQITYAVIGAF